MNDMFRMEKVQRSFGRKSVLQDLDLCLVPGECTVLLGRNGAGKSTLLRLALGVMEPDAGSVIVAGVDPMRDPTAARIRTGYVPDTPDAPRWMKLGELARFTRPHYPTWNESLVQELTEQFAVPSNTRLGDMSRGESMKAMMILALAPEPDLLLLDEPFAGLDPVVRDEVLGVVVGALRQGERTVLCATHELDVAARIADRVAVLEGGRIAAHGTLPEVLGDDNPVAIPQQLREAMVSCAAGERPATGKEEELSC